MLLQDRAWHGCFLQTAKPRVAYGDIWRAHMQLIGHVTPICHLAACMSDDHSMPCISLYSAADLKWAHFKSAAE